MINFAEVVFLVLIANRWGAHLDTFSNDETFGGFLFGEWGYTIMATTMSIYLFSLPKLELLP